MPRSHGGLGGWTTDQNERLCELFETNRCLYDSTTSEYQSRRTRIATLIAIGKELNKTPEQIKKKLENFRTQYGRELKKGVKLELLNDAGEEVPVSKWALLPKLKFLDDFLTPRPAGVFVHSPITKKEPADHSYFEDGEVGIGIEEPADDDGEFDQLPSMEQGPNKLFLESPKFEHTPKKKTAPPSNPTSSLFSGPVKRVRIYSKENNNDDQTDNPSSSFGEGDSFMKAVTAVEKIFSGRCSSSSAEEDNDDVFGRYIAGELRDIKDPQVKRLVKHQIQTILFNAQSEAD